MDDLFTSVHTLQTSAPLGPSTSYRAHTDRFVRSEVAFVSTIYNELETRNDKTKADRLSMCRTRAYFMRNVETGMLRIAASHCNLRWCPLCARTRRNFIAVQTESFLRTVSHPKLLTLTLKHSNDPLGMQITELYDAFKSLRKKALFKNNVRGGMWFFQIKRSKNSDQWHPHIHALIDSKFIPHRKLKMLWHKITGQSNIVDIRLVKNIEKTAKYVARYAASPCDLKALPFPQAVEVVRDMAGRRVCGTWGVARSVTLRPSKPDDADSWERFGSWVTVINMLESDPSAKEIFKAWKKNEPVAIEHDLSYVDDAIDGPPREKWEAPPPNPQQLLFEVY